MATGTFPTATETATTLAAYIPEVWSDKMNEFYREKLIAGKFFTDLSDELTQGGDILHIPSTSEMTAHAFGNSGAYNTAVTLNNPTESTVNLTVTTDYECSFSIPRAISAQVLNKYTIQERYAKGAAYSVGKVYEQAILDLFPAFSQTTGSSAAVCLDSNIRAAIQALDEALVPQEDRAFFFTPKQMWTDIMAIDRFTLVDNAPTADPVNKGAVGKLYGYDVYVSQLVGATTGSANSCFAHKDALVHASTVMAVDSNYIPEYLAVLTTAEVVYGVIENRDTSGVWIKTADA